MISNENATALFHNRIHLVELRPSVKTVSLATSLEDFFSVGDLLNFACILWVEIYNMIF